MRRPTVLGIPSVSIPCNKQKQSYLLLHSQRKKAAYVAVVGNFIKERREL
jgi:hypothetical protein